MCVRVLHSTGAQHMHACMRFTALADSAGSTVAITGLAWWVTENAAHGMLKCLDSNAALAWQPIAVGEIYLFMQGALAVYLVTCGPSPEPTDPWQVVTLPHDMRVLAEEAVPRLSCKRGSAKQHGPALPSTRAHRCRCRGLAPPPGEQPQPLVGPCVGLIASRHVASNSIDSPRW